MSNDNSNKPLEFKAPSIELLADLLPAYDFDKLIATGGMGAVYQATQTSLDRPVAIKILPPELGESEEFRESFAKEAKLMARLNHPNLIGVFDFGKIEDTLYIVMELVDGVTLYQKTYGGHLDQQEALEVIIAICRGLASAHEAGILHRDVKPANIFITQSGVPKVGDFGLARPSGDTETGIILGTPGYTAPEVLNNPDKVGPATDIFAVGIMLYELLAGKIPGDIYEPITKYSECDPMLDRLIRKAISPKLEQRYNSAEEFADELDEIFRSAKKGTKSSPLATPPTQQSAAPQLRASLTSKTAVKPALLAKVTPASEAKTTTLQTKLTAKTSVKPALLAKAVPDSEAKTTKLNPDSADNTVSNSKAKITSKLSQALPDKVNFLAAGSKANTRNFIIIGLLLIAIFGVLEWKSKREDYIALEEDKRKDIAQLEINQREKALQLRDQKKQPKPTVSAAAIAAPVRQLSDLEMLERVKARLAVGDRPLSDMPKSIISLDGGERLVLFINKEMTWHGAQIWAADYGGQLATIASSADIAALRKSIPSGDTAWIGAATAGNKQWAWSDGTPWSDSLDIRKTSKLSFAQLDSDMFASAKKSSATAKFLIEWKLDGSQPASPEKQMKRVLSTLDDSTPLFPAGSISFAGRNYYLCSKKMNLAEAKTLARSAGAQIATPSDAVETAYFSDFVKTNIPAGKICRIGGFLDNNEWKWLNGEEWKRANWEQHYPNEKGSVVIASTPTGQWRDASPNKLVAYTLFEWSADSPTTESSSTAANKGPIDSAFTKLQTKAAKLIDTAVVKREKEHTENVKRLKWDLEFYFNGLAKNEKVRQAASIQGIKALINGKDRIQQTVSGMGNSAKTQKLTRQAVEKQGRIDDSFDESIDKIRIVYQQKVRSIIIELEGKSQATAAKKAKAALKKSTLGPKEFMNIFN